MTVEGLSEREKRALENIILALKAGDKETARIILEEEISDKNKEKVIKYLLDLGLFPPSVKTRKFTTRTYRPVKRSLGVITKIRPEPPEPKRPQLKPELHFIKINVLEAAMQLVETANESIALASERIPRKLLRKIKSKVEEGVDVKLLLSENDCKALAFWGKKNVKCLSKELAAGLAVRGLPLIASASLPGPMPDLLHALLGAVIGLSAPATLALSVLELALWKPYFAYTQLPATLRIAAATSLVSLFIEKLLRRPFRAENLEVRVLDYVLFTVLIVDGKHALSSECPLSSSSPCFAKVYRHGAYEAVREFSLLWEAARPA